MPRNEAQKAQRRITSRAYYANNKEAMRAKNREWHENHPGRDAEYSRNRRLKHPEKTKAEWRKYRAKNPHLQAEISKRWSAKNKDKINAHERERCAKDPAYRIAKALRCRVREKLKLAMASKSDSTMQLTSCDSKFLMGYLEARFKQGMKWSNYGSVWEIDHRVPCSSFDLTDESHQRSCFHYTNLQPMFVGDNRKKWATLPGPHQAELI